MPIAFSSSRRAASMSWRDAGEHEHLGAERVRDLHEVRRPFALERGDRLLDLERVAARAAERPIHRRDERDAGQP